MNYTNRDLRKMLLQLEMAFMPLTMKENNEGEKCIYCWETDCDCYGESVKTDQFINTSEEIKVYDIQYA